MGKLLLLLAAPLSLVTPSQAGSPYNWTGCYLGANGGYNWGRSSTETVPGNPVQFGQSAPFCLDLLSTRFSPKGGSAGGQIGCNYQSGQYVFGVESDLNWFGLRGAVTVTGQPLGLSTLTSITEVSTDWLWTGRLRAGVVFDRTLLYATAGIAVTRVRYSQSNLIDPCGINGCPEDAATSATKAGWTVGGGMETPITSKWTIKGEYLYARFENVRTTGEEFISGVGPGPVVFDRWKHTATLGVHTVRVGINYQWGGVGN